MMRVHSRTEFRFFVPGKPESFRSPSAGTYKERVADVARSVFEDTIENDGMEIRLDHFHPVNRRADMDNIAKSVMDALTGIAYVDDIQVRLQQSMRHDLRNIIRLHDHPIDVVKPLSDYDEYLFVRLRVPVD